MFVSEDGTVTGSVDVSKLDEVEAKTDEAKAQIEALKAERDAGQRQADTDAARVAEQAAAQAAQLSGEPAKDEEPGRESAATILERVGDDRQAAAEALAAEQASPNPRSTLVAKLERLSAREEG